MSVHIAKKLEEINQYDVPDDLKVAVLLAAQYIIDMEQLARKYTYKGYDMTSEEKFRMMKEEQR